MTTTEIAAAPATKKDALTGRIVVGVDGSPGSEAALTWALHEARLRGDQVCAVFAWEFRPAWGDPVGRSLSPMSPNWAGESVCGLPVSISSDAGLEDASGHPTGGGRVDAEAAIANILDATVTGAIRTEDSEQSRPAVHLSQQLIEGHPAQALLEMITPADLLVVGSRGHGTFAGTMLGSISQHLVAHACCPVVVVPNPVQ
jgi:nucleotide-binding universal stress UspA family protein